MKDKTKTTRDKKTFEIYHKIELIILCAAAMLFAILFLFVEESAICANAIYIATVAVYIIYTVALLFFFPQYDFALHYKALKKYYQPTKKRPLPIKRTGLWLVILIWMLFLIFLYLMRKLEIIPWDLFLCFGSIVLVLNNLFIGKQCLVRIIALRNVKCCASCHINGWDYPIFLSALLFAPYLSDLQVIINICAALLSFAYLIFWEYTLYTHPEYFSPVSNASLRCSACQKSCNKTGEGDDFYSKLANRIGLIVDKIIIFIEKKCRR